MKKIAFHIQKGGTGKTTLSGNIAYCSGQSRKTILIDVDPQGNSSSWFITETPKYELVDILRGNTEAGEAIIHLSEQFYILPTFGLTGALKQYAESQLNDTPFIFEDLCGELEKLGFVIAVFDLSPGMSRLEKCVLLAMDEVVTPLTPEYFSIDGISIFNNELKKINKAYRRNVQHKKIIANNVNRTFRRHNVFYNQFKALDYELFSIGQDSKLAESQIYNKSIFEYYPASKAIPELKKLTSAIVGA